MKAGLKIHVSKIDLLSGSSDVVPKRLYTHDGTLVEVAKYYHVQTSETALQDIKGKQFVVVDGGWVTPVQANQQDSQTNGGTSDDEPKPF